jgi:undecaprenyl diphosphate synthase
MHTLPKHIAIVMDGNGRWAKQRNLPRMAGHKAGAESVKEAIKFCLDKGIEILTLFAFSTENWNRPPEEVNYLMDLLGKTLQKNAKKFLENNVRVYVVGDFTRLNTKLCKIIEDVQSLTVTCTKLKLVIALNYSGRWELTEVVRKLGKAIEAGHLRSQEITPKHIQENLSMAAFPDPDLFIRTSGELRISNFMLWELAYTELYFTSVLWPDFRQPDFEKALHDYAKRKRRFGGLGV